MVDERWQKPAVTGHIQNDVLETQLKHIPQTRNKVFPTSQKIYVSTKLFLRIQSLYSVRNQMISIIHVNYL